MDYGPAVRPQAGCSSRHVRKLAAVVYGPAVLLALFTHGSALVRPLLPPQPPVSLLLQPPPFLLLQPPVSLLHCTSVVPASRLPEDWTDQHTAHPRLATACTLHTSVLLCARTATHLATASLQPAGHLMNQKALRWGDTSSHVPLPTILSHETPPTALQSPWPAYRAVRDEWTLAMLKGRPKQAFDAPRPTATSGTACTCSLATLISPGSSSHSSAPLSPSKTAVRLWVRGAAEAAGGGLGLEVQSGVGVSAAVADWPGGGGGDGRVGRWVEGGVLGGGGKSGCG